MNNKQPDLLGFILAAFIMLTIVVAGVAVVVMAAKYSATGATGIVLAIVIFIVWAIRGSRHA